MPRGDKTGPMGVGPMTGCGSGTCLGIGTSVRNAAGNGSSRAGCQRGRGGAMQGSGRGMRNRMGFNQADSKVIKENLED